jgi:hypothetical protein
VLAAAAAFTLVVGPWPTSPAAGFTGSVPRAHQDALRNAVALVPGDAAVSSTNALGGQLSARRLYYSVPVVGRAEWIVLDTWNPWLPDLGSRPEGHYPVLLRTFRARIEASPAWRRVFEEDGVLVYRRADG